jgi:hypothetical protein
MAVNNCQKRKHSQLSGDRAGRKRLRRHQDLMVLTNNLNVAMILFEVPGIELAVSGGTVRKADGGMSGATEVELSIASSDGTKVSPP